ncbi:MAG: 6-phosphogluconolactonase [Thermoleophilia bacterium]|jgi:glucosamine-6-phosphate deaminase
MAFHIFITRDFAQMSRVAADIVEADIKQKQAAKVAKSEYVLGLATGSSPTGLYKHLAQAFNDGRLDAARVRSFNLDEYVGLPGENAQQRCLHRESYNYFMIQELFGLLRTKFVETNIPWGTLVEQSELIAALDEHPGEYEMQGSGQGKAIIIKDGASGILGSIKRDILDEYERKIKAAGGIDLQIVGVGGRGHVAFHEIGIPFEGNHMLLVKLDDNTVENAVQDGHFPSIAESPHYAISMSAELIYQAPAVVLLASGSRKTGPVAESVLGDVTCDVPISYGQKYVAAGGQLFYVLDEVAAAELLARRAEAEAKGVIIEDLRAKV